MDLDPLFFSWMTVMWELVIILPVYLLELRRKRAARPVTPPLQDRPRNHWKLLVFVGAAFSLSVYLMVVGYHMTGSVTGMLIVKTSPLFAMLIGALYLHERITLAQLGFTLVLLAGVYVLATKGTFLLGEFSLGVAILLIVPFLWNVAHGVTKPLLSQRVMTTPETIVIRMMLCSVFLGIFCLLFRGTQDFWQLASPPHLWSMFLMGAVYGILHFAWYKLLTDVGLSTATAIMVPTPVVTMIAAFFITQEVLQWYHLVGLGTAFMGLYGIIYEQKRAQREPKKAGTA